MLVFEPVLRATVTFENTNECGRLGIEKLLASVPAVSTAAIGADRALCLLDEPLLAETGESTGPY